MIKVLITDDHPIVRRGLRQILEDETRINMIHEAGNGKELFEKLKEQEYDVILLDISLPGRSGLDLISQIKKTQRSAAILMFSIHSEDIYAINAIKSGADGYIAKSSAPEELVKAIMKVANGEKYISHSLVEKMTDMLMSESDKSIRQSLSAREVEVLNLFASGKTVVQIASELCLSPKTISTYRERLLVKLNLSTTADLIRYGILEELSDHK